MDKKREHELKLIGLNIAYIRKMRNMTQLDLAEKVSISRTHLSNIEATNVTTGLSLDTLLDIADALDVPAASLLNFDRTLLQNTQTKKDL